MAIVTAANDASVEQDVDYKAAVLRAVDRMRELRSQLKEARQMWKDALIKDEAWKAVDDLGKKFREDKKNLETRILQNSFNFELKKKASDKAAEVAEAKDFLSAYLDEYQRRTGEKVIVDGEGKKLVIIKQLRLRI